MELAVNFRPEYPNTREWDKLIRKTDSTILVRRRRLLVLSLPHLHSATTGGGNKRRFRHNLIEASQRNMCVYMI